MNLISRIWIPVRRRSGSRDVISPAGLVSDYRADPVIAPAWNRADLDVATYEFLIGLAAATYPHAEDDRGAWEDDFHTPPDLEARFAPLVPHFEVEQFVQDFDDLDASPEPAVWLMMNSPGEKTTKENACLFVKNNDGVLSRPAAAIALFALQSWATSGGRGRRTGVRGGGPLTTLAIPDGDRPTTLWETIWLNTPADRRLSDPLQAFPWLSATKTSTKGETIHENEANRLQALWGAPRRIRLVWEQNTARMCTITGALDEVVCTGFRTISYGANYGVWRHPLSPYYYDKKDSEWRSIHAQTGRLGYRDWVALVAGGEGRRAALCVLQAKERLEDLGRPWRDGSRLFAAGYAMSQDKAEAFVSATMPLHTVDRGIRLEIERVAAMLIAASAVVSKALWGACKRARVAPSEPCNLLWTNTEQAFHETLDGDLGRAGETWLVVLLREATAVFDAYVQVGEDIARAQQVVEARKWLVLALRGYGPEGKRLFATLALPQVETKKARKK